MKKGVKYGLKFLGWFFLGILLLLLVVGVLIQTRPVKKKLATIAEKQAAGFVNGKIRIGEIDGNFFTSLQLKDLLWKYNDDTVTYIASIDLRYDLRPLLGGHLLVHSIDITRPFFHLKQVNDSTWNVQQLIKESSSEADTVETEESSSFRMDFSSVKLKEGRLTIDSNDTIIPQQISQLDIDLSLHWGKKRQQFKLENFSFVAQKPDVTLEQLAFNVSRDDEMIGLSGFRLKTKQNELQGEGTFVPPFEQATAHFQSTPLQPGEFEFLLPSLKIPATPELNMDAHFKNDSLRATIDLAENEQNINFTIRVNHIGTFFTNPAEFVPEYELSGNLENIKLSHWTGNPEYNYLINGNLSAQGKGIDTKTMEIALQGNFKDCVVEDKILDKIAFDFYLNHGDLAGKADGSGDFGSFSLKPKLKDLFGTPAYQLELVTQQLNLAALMGNDSLQSDINLKAHVQGRGFEPKTLRAKANLIVDKSSFNSINLDTLFADVQYENNNLQLDSLWLKTQSARLMAHGNYALDAHSEMWLSARFDSLSEFEQFIPVDSLYTSGDINAHLRGTTDSLFLQSDVHLDSIRYSSFFIKRVTLDANASVNKTDTLVNATLLAEHLQNNSQQIDSVVVDVEANTDSLYMNARVADTDIETSLSGGVSWQKKLCITLEKWLVKYKDQQLALQQPPAIIEIDSVNYFIHNFKMASNASDTTQYISAEGNISRSGDEDLELSIKNIDIANWLGVFGNPLGATGKAGFELKIDGTASAPVVKGSFGIDNAVLNSYRFTDFGGTFNYADKQFSINTSIVPVDSGRIKIEGAVPLVMALDSFNFNFSTKDSIDLQLDVDKFPLAVIQTLNISENIAGFIDGSIKVTGTAESPNPNGELKLIDAAVKMPEYGIDYRNILFNLSFLRDNIRLDTLQIETSDGSLKGNGKIDFSSDFYKGDISQSEVTLRFNKFNPVDHRQFNMQLSGDASLGGEKGNVVFDGDLNIPEAEIYLPAVLNMMGKFYVPEIPKPLLVQALEEQTNATDSLPENQSVADTTEQFSFDYFNKLTGKMRIKIPKNTWVKNEDLRIEVSGDFELIKHETFFELFGSVDVVRGQYDMLGKTFVIDEGTITFEGGEELMPKMNITASYAFRNAQREEKKLDVTITGTADSPAVSFTLNGSAVNEGDALSYILFGRGMNELSIDQQDNLNGAGGGQLAETAAASILSSQISNFLSKKLNVDYIEVKSNGGFDNATVVVGKYLTNDLFVSYEQRFGATDQKDIDKYEVKLEYELFKFLFFQLNNSSSNSGFDVIFKVNSK